MSTKQSGQSSPVQSGEVSPSLMGPLGSLSARGVDERAFSMFQPDILIPAQYLATTKRTQHLEPEKRLMLAVLEDAIFCFQHHMLGSTSKEQMRFRDAENWILEKDGDWLFSFDNICDALGFDPRYIREGLMRWKQRNLTGHPRARVYHLIPGEKHNNGQERNAKSLIHEFLTELSRFVS